MINICINGLVYGFLYALIALGYTMVYGIVELINFAHGDLFMLGSMLAWSMVGTMAVGAAPGSATAIFAILVMLLVVPIFCAALKLGRRSASSTARSEPPRNSRRSSRRSAFPSSS